MTEINPVKVDQQMYSAQPYGPQQGQYATYPAYSTQNQKTVRDEFVSQHKKNGLIERLYNGIKNLTGLGVGSKKAEKAVEKAENGEISEEEARNTITKYRNSQATSAQVAGDAASVGVAGLAFFKISKYLKMNGAEAVLNKKFYASSEDVINKNVNEKFLKFGTSNVKVMKYAAIFAGLAAGITKLWFGRINRIGSKEFSVDKKDFNNLATEYDENAYKFEKKAKRRQKQKANWRNLLSGTINGITMPLTLLGGAIVGVPAYLVTNLFNRYFVGNTTERKKSFNSFVDNLKNDAIIQAGLVAGTAIPLVKNGRFTKVLDTNMKKAVDKLSKASLKRTEFQAGTAYEDLVDTLMGESAISEIVYKADNGHMDLQEAIQKLTKENIFAVKFKQIEGDAESLLTMELRENCPASRTLEDAAKKIKDAFGTKYDAGNIKLLGVGTVAETYLVKGSDGKEVCIKMLKDGIDANKINADYEKFVDIVKQSRKSDKDKEYLLKNLSDLKEGILKEIDLANEKNAAEELVKYTKSANVVKPIEVKDNLYVMEKADGISLETLMNLHIATQYKEALEKGGVFSELGAGLTELIGGKRLQKLLDNAWTKEDKLEILNKEIERIKSRSPQFDDFDLTDKEIEYMLKEYAQVLTEQLDKVSKNGRVMHADIHPGNIFINIDVLKKAAGKENKLTKTADYMGWRFKNNKMFTLIDTGNVIHMNPEQSAQFIKLSSYVNRGSYQDIAEYFIDGATLPEGLSKSEAVKTLSNELKNIFLDTETKIDVVTNDSIAKITSNIMKKHNIIPADTQLNLNKARKSAEGSLKEMEKALLSTRTSNINGVGSLFGSIKDIAGDGLFVSKYRKNLQSKQEKFNLRQMSAAERKKYKKNPNLLATNSEDYLTYKLKQKMLIKEKPETY